MSTDEARTEVSPELVDKFAEYLRDYYREDIATIAQTDKDGGELHLDWMDLFQYDRDLAEDYLDQPRKMHRQLEYAVREVPLPIPGELDDVNVRVMNVADRVTYSPAVVAKISDADPGYIAVEGQLSKVTTPAKKMDIIAYECVRCDAITHVEQPSDEITEPGECSSCERNGPYEINHAESIREPHVRLRIEAPPNDKGQLSHEEIDAIATDDIVWTGHEDYGIAARSGEPVTVYGTVEMEQLGNSTLFTERLKVWAIEFENDRETVDVAENKDEFAALADREDPVEVFKESLVPQLHATPEWDTALELLVAYLFGAPRVDIPNGATYRGDIHTLIVSDYGMGKSMVNEAVAEFSPDCIKESVTGLSSDVGLLAAAVKDDFGEGDSWTIEPGVLVRGDGGHVILDEIDKTDADLERMNDALEGEQVVDINKAGQSATFKSRCGLLATGNPSGSRFDAHDAVADQLNIGESLLSRFDGIVTMRDSADEETDAAIARTHGQSYVEAQEYQYGDREELDQLDREVSPEVGRAWVAYAREHVNPLVSPEHIDEIEDWYATEVRKLNEDMHGDGDTDQPVPATAREVGAVIRFACAFARVKLQDRVTDADVQRAMDLEKTLIGQTFDEESGQFATHTVQSATQQSRVDAVKQLVAALEVEGDEPGVDRETVAEKLSGQYDTTKVQSTIDSLLQKGVFYEPQTGVIETT